MGGMIQLVAVGPQDVYLTDNPTMSFFRQRFCRPTPFAVETIEHKFTGIAGYGRRATCTLGRHGDLVTQLVMEITLKKSTGATFYPAEHLLKNVDLYIGEQKIDTVTNTWLRLYDELYRPVDAREGYAQTTDFGASEPAGTVKRFLVPLPFWFSRGDPTAALPVVALQYHDVAVAVDFEEAVNIPGIDTSFQPEVSLWVDTVFLGIEERKWFAQTPHKYMIEQTQMHSESIDVTASEDLHNVTLPFNHPVKFLAWVLRPSATSHGIFTGSGDGLESLEVAGPLSRVGMQLNGTERFAPRRGSFFRLPHALSTFGQAPSVGVYTYSFALRPAAPTSSGSLNFSRIDTARLQLTTKAAVVANVVDASDDSQTLTASTGLSLVEVYARNHNVLRIESGMAGLEFTT
jgi:hypothetical protein